MVRAVYKVVALHRLEQEYNKARDNNKEIDYYVLTNGEYSSIANMSDEQKNNHPLYPNFHLVDVNNSTYRSIRILVI